MLWVFPAKGTIKLSWYKFPATAQMKLVNVSNTLVTHSLVNGSSSNGSGTFETITVITGTRLFVPLVLAGKNPHLPSSG